MVHPSATEIEATANFRGTHGTQCILGFATIHGEVKTLPTHPKNLSGKRVLPVTSKPNRDQKPNSSKDHEQLDHLA
jgi:hypothetical protein